MKKAEVWYLQHFLFRFAICIQHILTFTYSMNDMKGGVGSFPYGPILSEQQGGREDANPSKVQNQIVSKINYKESWRGKGEGCLVR